MEENERKLVPMVFDKVIEKFPWGTETYNIADLGFVDTTVHGGWLDGNALCEMMETYLERMVGDNAFYYYGRQFPLMVKRLEFNDVSPLMVCPGDEVAAQRYDALGKAKFWYVVSASEGAYLGIGLRAPMTAEEFYFACGDGSIMENVNRIPVKAGDYFMIAPGTVHYVPEGVVLLEIAEASAMDFVLSRSQGYASVDELGAADAIDFVNLSAGGPAELSKTGEYGIASSVEFTVSMIRVENSVKISTADSDSCFIYTCVSGEAAILSQAGPQLVKAGDSVLVPADCTEFAIEARRAGTVILEAAPSRREEEDGYIDKNAEPSIEE